MDIPHPSFIRGRPCVVLYYGLRSIDLYLVLLIDVTVRRKSSYSGRASGYGAELSQET